MKVKATKVNAPQLASALAYKVYFQEYGDPTLNGATVTPCARPDQLSPNETPPTTCPYGPLTMPTFGYQFRYDGSLFVSALLPTAFLCIWQDNNPGVPSTAVLRLSTFLGVPAWTISWVSRIDFSTGLSVCLASTTGAGTYSPDAHWTEITVF